MESKIHPHLEITGLQKVKRTRNTWDSASYASFISGGVVRHSPALDLHNAWCGRSNSCPVSVALPTKRAGLLYNPSSSFPISRCDDEMRWAYLCTHVKLATGQHNLVTNMSLTQSTYFEHSSIEQLLTSSMIDIGILWHTDILWCFFRLILYDIVILWSPISLEVKALPEYRRLSGLDLALRTSVAAQNTW